jgi:hypothetical protein
LGNERCIGLRQCSIAVAAYQGEAEDVEELRLRISNTVFFLEFFYFSFAGKGDECIVVGEYSRRFLDERKVIAKGLAQRLRDARLIFNAIGVVFRDDPVDAVRRRMKRIEAELIGNEREDQDSAGDPGGQAEDIDKRVRLVLPEIAPGDLDIIA